MQKLHLVGVTTDHEGLILSTRRGARSGSYLLTVDAKLEEVVDDLRARRAEEEADVASAESTAPRAPRVESSLPVREIQARLRQGRTINEVAKAAGVTPEWVERFAAPVLAERAQVISTVQSGSLRRARLGVSRLAVGEAVRHHLADRGVAQTADEHAAAWSARQVADGRWTVRFTFRYRGRDQVLRFDLDEAAGEVSTADRLSAQMGYLAPASAPSPGDKPRPTRTTPPAEPRPVVKRAVVSTGFRPEPPGKAQSRSAKEREKASAAMRKAAERRAAESERAAARKAKERQEAQARREREEQAAAAQAARAARIAQAAATAKAAEKARAERIKAAEKAKADKLKAAEKAKADQRKAAEKAKADQRKAEQRKAEQHKAAPTRAAAASGKAPTKAAAAAGRAVAGSTKAAAVPGRAATAPTASAPARAAAGSTTATSAGRATAGAEVSSKAAAASRADASAGSAAPSTGSARAASASARPPAVASAAPTAASPARSRAATSAEPTPATPEPASTTRPAAARSARRGDTGPSRWEDPEPRAAVRGPEPRLDGEAPARPMFRTGLVEPASSGATAIAPAPAARATPVTGNGTSAAANRPRRTRPLRAT